MKQTIRLTESDLHRLIKESVKRVLNEKFGSQKLAQFAQQHGGINGKFSSQYNDLSQISDEEFDQYIPVDQQRYEDDIQNGKIDTNNGQAQPLAFNDGTFLVKRSSTWGNNQGYQNLIQKQNDRTRSQRGDFLQRKQNTLNNKGTLRNMYQQTLKPAYQQGGMQQVNQTKDSIVSESINEAIGHAIRKLLK